MGKTVDVIDAESTYLPSMEIRESRKFLSPSLEVASAQTSLCAAEGRQAAYKSSMESSSRLYRCYVNKN